MKTRTLSASKQRGFSLLTGFILVIMLFGSLAFFLAGSGINSAFVSPYANISKVSSLLTSASYIETGFSSVTLGGTDPDSVKFDTTATTGIFNPTSGAATQPSLDPTLFVDTVAPDGAWIYANRTITLNGVGSAAITGDYTMVVAGLKKGICQQINNMLHGIPLTGSATVANPVVLTGKVLADLVGTPTVLGTSYLTSLANTALTPAPVQSLVDLAALGIPGWANGCYETTDVTPIYVYIHTLLAQ
jgi:hypothetical protein